jgi:hypothetical protein
MRLAIADQSTIATFGWQAWLVLAAITLIAATFHAIADTPKQDAQPSNEPRTK